MLYLTYMYHTIQVVFVTISTLLTKDIVEMVVKIYCCIPRASLDIIQYKK